MDSINHPGIIDDDYLHEGDEVYISSEDLEARYGMEATDAQIRIAMVMMHDYCNRRTLWPAEYMQRLSLPDDRNTAVLAVKPILRVLEVKGRYTAGRRDHRQRNNPYGYVGIDALLGASSQWVDISTESVEFFAPTGEVWFPAGILLAPYGDIQIRYIAGYPQIPEKAILALALLVNSICSKGDSDMIAYSSGRVSRRFGNATFLNRDIKRLLNLFVVHSLE